MLATGLSLLLLELGGLIVRAPRERMLVASRTGVSLSLFHAVAALAAGVTLGDLPKLLSLSNWVWWPPGPRPKQAALYPRRLAQLEAACFAAGVEVLALGTYLGSDAAARLGVAVLLAAAVLATATTARVWRKRSRAAIRAA